MPLAASLIAADRCYGPPAPPAAEFTPAQRAEIVAIVRDALKQDPSILRDAVVALQADDGERTPGGQPRAAIAQARRSW